MEKKTLRRESIVVTVCSIISGILIASLLTRFVGMARVIGTSMEPTYHNGNILVMDKALYRFDCPARGDVVMVGPIPGFVVDSLILKRVVGVPGDTVKIIDNKLYINGALQKEDYIKEPMYANFDLECVLSEDEFFLLGDNRNISLDSRVFGPVSIDDIWGRVLFNKL